VFGGGSFGLFVDRRFPRIFASLRLEMDEKAQKVYAERAEGCKKKSGRGSCGNQLKGVARGVVCRGTFRR